jgi:hypothetical protein
MASAQSHTHFLDSPRIRASLSRSDFRFEELKTTAMSVYLILPADRLKTFDRWLRLLIQQAITVNARNIEEKPERPILFLLDEMAALGRLPALEQAFGLMAGFGMQLWGIVQDLSQLARIYGEHGWQTFISNSGVIQYFGSRDKMTAEYFSTLCGVTTIEVHNFSWAMGKVLGVARSFTSSVGGGSSGNSSSESASWTRTTGINEAQRKLAYPDELMVMKEDQQVVFVENLDPIPARKIRWFEDAELKRHGVNLVKVPAEPDGAASIVPPSANATAYAGSELLTLLISAATGMVKTTTRGWRFLRNVRIERRLGINKSGKSGELLPLVARFTSGLALKGALFLALRSRNRKARQTKASASLFAKQHRAKVVLDDDVLELTDVYLESDDTPTPVKRGTPPTQVPPARSHAETRHPSSGWGASSFLNLSLPSERKPAPMIPPTARNRPESEPFPVDPNATSFLKIPAKAVASPVQKAHVSSSRRDKTREFRCPKCASELAVSATRRGAVICPNCKSAFNINSGR